MQGVKEYGETLVMKLLLYRNFFQSPAQRFVNLFSVILYSVFFSQKLYESKNKKKNVKRHKQAKPCLQYVAYGENHQNEAKKWMHRPCQKLAAIQEFF